MSVPMYMPCADCEKGLLTLSFAETLLSVLESSVFFRENLGDSDLDKFLKTIATTTKLKLEVYNAQIEHDRAGVQAYKIMGLEHSYVMWWFILVAVCKKAEELIGEGKMDEVSLEWAISSLKFLLRDAFHSYYMKFQEVDPGLNYGPVIIDLVEMMPDDVFNRYAYRVFAIESLVLEQPAEQRPMEILKNILALSANSDKGAEALQLQEWKGRFSYLSKQKAVMAELKLDAYGWGHDVGILGTGQDKGGRRQ